LAGKRANTAGNRPAPTPHRVSYNVRTSPFIRPPMERSNVKDDGSAPFSVKLVLGLEQLYDE